MSGGGVTSGVVVNEKFELHVGQLPLRSLEENDILVKIHSAPINPSDILFSKGFYPAGKVYPTFVGLEGSGLVVEAGAKAAHLKEKRIAFFAAGKHDLGSWGEQIVIDAGSAFPLPDNLTYEEACTSLINPLTVQAMIVRCQKDGRKAIIHSAAASALGKMLVHACKKYGLTLINIVRRDEQVKILKDLGAEHVLNSSSETFEHELSALLAETKADTFFDAIGGKFGSRVIELLPPKSWTFNYGALSGEGYNVGVADLIFKYKVLTGFWVTEELRGPDAATIVADTFANLAAKVYTTSVAKRFPYAQFAEALEFYQKNMTEGKVIIQNPSF